MSCETRRSSAYSVDLRWRIVWQYHALRLQPKRVAANLNIDCSTVRRVLHIFEQTGNVERKPYPSDKAWSEPVQLYIAYLVLEKPGIYLREIINEVSTLLGVDLTESAVCKFLKRSGFTRQKLRTFALQRSESLRSQFVQDVSIYKPETLLFVDETGSDQKDSNRKYGYSVRGHPINSQKLLVRGERLSCIAAISVQGLMALKIFRGNVDGDKFYDFVCSSLLPLLQPFNGTNSNSTLIMDNCSIHHVEEVQDVLTDAGIVTHYLPPYSPDYNPIELAFSKVKYTLKSLEAEMQAINDVETILLAAFACITPADCQGWIGSIGIY